MFRFNTGFITFLNNDHEASQRDSSMTIGEPSTSATIVAEPHKIAAGADLYIKNAVTRDRFRIQSLQKVQRYPALFLIAFR